MIVNSTHKAIAIALILAVLILGSIAAHSAQSTGTVILKAKGFSFEWT